MVNGLTYTVYLSTLHTPDIHTCYFINLGVSILHKDTLTGDSINSHCLLSSYLIEFGILFWDYMFITILSGLFLRRPWKFQMTSCCEAMVLTAMSGGIIRVKLSS